MVVDAACAAAGAHRVDNPTQMADLLAPCAGRGGCPAAGPRSSPTAAGTARWPPTRWPRPGCETPVLTGAVTTRRSMRALWAQATRSPTRSTSPAPGSRTSTSYARAVEILLAADEVDGVLMTGYFGGYSTEQSGLTDARARRGATRWPTRSRPGQAGRRAHDLPGQPGQPGAAAAGIPVHRDVDRACAVLAGLVEPATAGLAEELPAAAPPVTDTSYDGARGLFADAGVAFPAAVSVTDAAGLEAALEAPG